MASKLNFSAQLNLYTKGFEKGINNVKRQLKSLGGTFKSFAASMGAGLGIYQLVSQMSSVAKELNTAKTTLKNVSESMADYNKSMQLAKNLARDYSQDMVSLTSNLASFQASAKGTGIALSDVNEIFTSLTKASAYFNLSSQQTSQVLTAVAQMMSKGTIQAQELKLQLANVLPGAFSIMANAVGVTTSELDKLMSQGKLAAKDVLPKFAQELNKMTAGKIDTTGLQSSMNRLKNTFTQLVESVNFDRMMSKGITALDNTLGYILKHFKMLQGVAISLMAALSVNKIKELGGAALGLIKNIAGQIKGVYRLISKNNRQVLINVEKRNLRSAVSKQMDLAHTNRQNYLAYEAGKRGGASMEDLKKLHQALQQSDAALESNRKKIKRIKESIRNLEHPWKNVAKQIFSIQGLLQLVVAGLAAGAYALVDWLKKTKEIKNALNKAAKEMNDFVDAADKGGKKSMAEQEALLSSQLAIIKDTTLEEGKRKEAITQINSILGLEKENAFDIKSSYEDIVKKANEWLSVQEKIAQVNAYTASIADAQVQQEENRNKIRSAFYEGWTNTFKQREGESPEDYQRRFNNYFNNTANWRNADGGFRESSITRKAQRYSRNVYGATLQTLDASANAMVQAEQTLRGKLEELLKDLGENYTKALKIDKKDKEEVATNNIKEKIDDYLKSSEELANQQKRNAISAAEYKQQMDDLVVKTYREITALSDMEEQLKVLPEKYKNTADDIAKQFTSINGMAMIADELEKYRQSLKELKNQVDNNTITEDEYNDSLQTLKSDTYKAISSLVNFSEFLDGLPKDIADVLKEQLKGLGEAFKAELEKGIREAAQEGMKYLGNMNKKPEMKSGDATYSKSNKALGQQKDLVDIDISNLENAIAELKNSTSAEDWGIDVNDAIEDLSGQLEKARDKAKKLDDMMKFNDAIDELKKLKLQIVDAFFNIPDTMTGLADSVKEVIGAFNEDIDFEKYDKVMGKIKAIISLVNQVKNAVETALAIKMLFASMKDMEETISLMKATASVTDMVTKATKGEAIAQGFAAAATRKKATANITEASSNLTAAAAADTKAGSTAKEAVAESASSAAKIPVVGWVMAGVAIAAMAGALIASFAKFATGGIVGGNSKHGDNNIIRANSGEMVMNANQQKRLWNIISGKSSIGVAGGGEVKFRIRGAELEGVLNNYRKQRKG